MENLEWPEHELMQIVSHLHDPWKTRSDLNRNCEYCLIFHHVCSLTCSLHLTWNAPWIALVYSIVGGDWREKSPSNHFEITCAAHDWICEMIECVFFIVEHRFSGKNADKKTLNHIIVFDIIPGVYNLLAVVNGINVCLKTIIGPTKFGHGMIQHCWHECIIHTEDALQTTENSGHMKMATLHIYILLNEMTRSLKISFLCTKRIINYMVFQHCTSYSFLGKFARDVAFVSVIWTFCVCCWALNFLQFLLICP